MALLSIYRFNISFPNRLIWLGYTLSVIHLDMEGGPYSIMFCPFCFVMLHILQIPSEEDGWFLSLSYYHKGLFVLITLMSCEDWGRISLESGCHKRYFRVSQKANTCISHGFLIFPSHSWNCSRPTNACHLVAKGMRLVHCIPVVQIQWSGCWSVCPRNSCLGIYGAVSCTVGFFGMNQKPSEVRVCAVRHSAILSVLTSLLVKCAAMLLWSTLTK
jgi:hypothetical protein